MILLTTLLLACSGDSAPGASEPAPPSRVQSVAVQSEPPRPAEAPATWCDKHTAADVAEPFDWPELDGASAPVGAGWTWVNAWATWCKPCIEEMPRLTQWETTLQAEVGPGSVKFLSLDASAAALATFQQAHPDFPAGVRIKDESLMDPWVKELGLEPAAAALPIHVFLDADQKVRCVYMGGISEAEYDTVRGVLKSL